MKEINDTYGHEAGDTALCAVAQILQDSCGDEDFIMRYGGDEFVVIAVGSNEDLTDQILASADATYNSTYGWTRGQELADGTSHGHTAVSQRTLNLNGKLNFENLYKKWKFLDEANKRFSGTSRQNNQTSRNNPRNATQKAGDAAKGQDGKKTDGKDDGKKTKGFSQEVTLNDSTAVEVKHGQNSRRIVVRAKNEKGRSYPIKFKKVDENTIRITNKDTVPIEVFVTAKPKLEDAGWYKAAQVAARGLMMVRNASISYRNTYSLTLPGFSTEIGDFFGQRKLGGMLSPGLDFAFGMIDDNYVQKAY